MPVILDAKVFVLFMLYWDPSCKNEFEKCIRESKPINIDEEKCIKNTSEVMKWIRKEIIGKKIYVTPQLLAEYSNWLEKYVKDEKYRNLMKNAIEIFSKKEKSSKHYVEEHYVEMERMVKEEKILIDFGFSDVSIYLCSKDLNNLNKDGRVTLITSDGELSGLCKNNRINVVNIYNPDDYEFLKFINF